MPDPRPADPRPSDARVLLDALHAHLRRTGLPVERLEGAGDVPIPSIRWTLPGVGGRPTTVHFSFLVPPGLADPAQRVLLLQILAQIAAEVGPDRTAELQWLLCTLNNRLPLGAFALEEEDQLIHYRQSVMILTDLPPAGQVRMADLQTGMMIHMLHTFTDLVLDVAEGASAPEALVAHPMAGLFV